MCAVNKVTPAIRHVEPLVQPLSCNADASAAPHAGFHLPGLRHIVCNNPATMATGSIKPWLFRMAAERTLTRLCDFNPHQLETFSPDVRGRHSEVDHGGGMAVGGVVYRLSSAGCRDWKAADA